MSARARHLPRGNVGGILATFLLHGAVAYLIVHSHQHPSEVIEAPREFVVARMVRLGKPRDKFWLPRLETQPRPKAPVPTLKLSEDAHAKAAAPEAPRPENADVSKDVRHALDRARKLQALATPDEPAEGLETGSLRGTASQASAGDAYATAINDAIHRNWNVPTGLVSDSELKKLHAGVRVSVGTDGKLHDVKVVKSSGNSLFDESCLTAVQATGRVPPPPAALQKIYGRGVVLEFSPEQ
jgi:colicin import membrane protein